VSELIVKLKTPHINQQRILNEAKRFNVIKNGRRFGKTEMAKELASIALDGKYVGFWAPTYKDLHEVWNELKYTYYEVISEKNEQVKQLVLITGGKIDMWSMEDPNSGRGRKYHRAIMDEFAKAKKNKEAWQETIRPTLTDFKGDAWFLSTPKGKRNYFYELGLKAKELEDWSYWHMTTFDNPYIDPTEVEEAKRQLDDITFRQEYLAEDVDANDKPFMYAFKEDLHIKKGLEYNPHLPLWLMFDFNYTPMTCGVGQRPNLLTFKILDEIELNESDPDEMCDHIIARYPEYIPTLQVTGDASGNNRSGLQRGLTYWKVIKTRLKLKDSQFHVRTKNPFLEDSRVLCNSVLQNANIEINDRCKNLIKDLIYASVDEEGNLVKDNALSGLHHFDWFRYGVHANFPDFIDNPRRYRK
jgi:hypothetical protein